ncbi:MAG: flagellar biosynthetic protein FliR [Psychromonas sp.]|jgi:flagellar biosynthetic protein FliR|uniref:flagellar biosynthetic protein FliR n=1 Tax=Psychromonas sp. TaxID=1884585 RepID=UPI0039E45F71
MIISFAEITQWLGLFWWPFMRISGVFMFAPIVGDGSVPVKVRLSLAVVMAMLVAPLITSPPAIDPFSLQAIVLSFTQLLWGLFFGFLFQIFFTVFTTIGQTISVQMGLAMAVMNDPANGISVAIVGRLFLFACTLLFLAFDGHLAMLALMVESFTVWPIEQGFSLGSLHLIINMMVWMFASAFAVAIPAIAAMLITNASFGFMNKAAPSLNIFALGFPMTMVLGLFALLLSFSGIGGIYFDVLMEAIKFARGYMTGGAL